MSVLLLEAPTQPVVTYFPFPAPSAQDRWGFLPVAGCENCAGTGYFAVDGYDGDPETEAEPCIGCMEIVHPTTKANLTAVIYLLRDWWIRHHWPDTYEEINHGDCEDFALEVLREFFGGENDKAMVYWDDSFAQDGYATDWDMKCFKHWGWDKVIPQEWLDLLPFSDGGHAFIVFEDGTCYDSEVPEGVPSFFHLPFYQRVLARYRINPIVRE